MTIDVDELVRLFAAKLRMAGMLARPIGDDSRDMLVEYRGEHLTLVLPEPALSSLLGDGDDLAEDLWGASVSGPEGAARLLTVHLEESLGTTDSEDLAGTWTYNGRAFVRG